MGKKIMSDSNERMRLLEAEKQTLFHHGQHIEPHFIASDIVRDIIIGASDGLTAPFTLAAGITEVAAGAISMGLGGYLAAKSVADHYKRELKREQEEIVAVPDNEVAEILADYVTLGVFVYVKFELGLEKPNPTRALQSAVTIAISYVLGGIVPLLPYMFIRRARDAMLGSVVVTLVALLFFSYAKGHYTA